MIAYIPFKIVPVLKIMPLGCLFIAITFFSNLSNIAGFTYKMLYYFSKKEYSKIKKQNKTKQTDIYDYLPSYSKAVFPYYPITTIKVNPFPQSARGGTSLHEYLTYLQSFVRTTDIYNSLEFIHKFYLLTRDIKKLELM